MIGIILNLGKNFLWITDAQMTMILEESHHIPAITDTVAALYNGQTMKSILHIINIILIIFSYPF